ncbi:MAG: Holliday junction resolvase RuvX [bacterium]
MSRFLGIDYGRRRVGLAISDSCGRIAMPLETIRISSIDELVNVVAGIVRERGVGEIIIGNPLRTDTGEESEISGDVFVLKEKLEKALSLKVHLLPEWLTSVEAEKILKRHKSRHLKRKGLIDKLSAAIILQTFLEMRWQKLKG